MLDSQLTDDFRFSRTYKVDIEDYMNHYHREWGFKSFLKKHNYSREEDLYGAIVDNLLCNDRLIQWWSDCITVQDKANVVIEAAFLEDAVLDTRDIAEIIDIVTCAGTQNEIYRATERLTEERFIERYKREQGCDYVEVDYLINIYAD